MLTPVASSENTHLAAYLEGAARRWPERVAVVDGDGTSSTYRELDDRAARVASFLRARGVGRGDRVGVVVPKSAASVTAIAGILRAGAAYVPVDWSAPGARNRSILADCGVRALFVHPESLARLRALPDWAPPETVVVIEAAGPSVAQPPGAGAVGAESWAAVLAADAALDPPSRSPDDLAYILYTSGSTGVPKGVTLTHRNATSFVEWCASVFAASEHDRFSSHAPFHFDLSILDLYLPQRHGAALVLIPDQAAQNPKLLAAVIEERCLTVWYSTPSILSLLAQLGGLDAAKVPSLRLVLFAGEVFPIKQLRLLARLWPHVDYYNLYGPTETNVCTFARVETPIPDDRADPWPIGPLCAHCEGLVLDDAGEEVAPGEEGLLHVGGPSVFRGYWGRPDLDAAVFVDRGGVRWYNTGDVVRGRAADGFVYAGRRDRMVKRRGYRIELGEIESALHRCDVLREAAVVAVPDADAGVRIVAYASPRDGSVRPSVIAMKSFCASALPGYMSPDRFVFVDALPRTSTDKVDYARLVREASAA